MFDNNPLKLRFPPSKYDVWSECSAAPYAWTKGGRVTIPDTDKFPLQRDKHSVNGLIAHQLKLMSTTPTIVKPKYYVGETIVIKGQSYTINHSHADIVQSAMDYILSFYSPGSVHHVEKTFGMEGMISHQKVIIDDIVETENVVHLFDFKTGGRNKIFAKNNGQLMCGMWSFVDHALTVNIKRKFHDLYIHVVQPNLDHYDCHRVTPFESRQFQMAVNEKVKLSNSKDRKFNAGDHCRYCEVSNCKTRIDRAIKMISGNKGALKSMSDIICIDDLNEQQLIEFYRNADFIIATCKNVKKTMTHQACAGKQFKGANLVTGPEGKREFIDKVKACRYLREKGLSDHNLFNREMVSVAQSESILGKKNLDDEFHELYNRKSAYPVLTFEDDDREDWFHYKKRKMDSDFESIDESPGGNEMDLGFLDNDVDNGVDLSFLNDSDDKDVDLTFLDEE